MRPSGLGRAASLVAAALLLHLVLILPNHPAAATWGALAVLPLELPVLLFGLMSLRPGVASTAVRVGVVAVLTLLTAFKAADFAMFSALGRGFNPVSDLPLVTAAFRLLSGAVGTATAVAFSAGAVLATALLAASLWWATGVWARLVPTPRAGRLATLAAILASVVAVAEIGQAMGRWQVPLAPPGAAFTARLGVERVVTAIDTVTQLRQFELAARSDPFAGSDGLLDAIDRDVFVIFVESYGRTSLDTPAYADLHRATLLRNARTLGDLGLSMRSGYVAAPTRGGQSWLSHATFANGLWIDSQTRYAAALASGRATLFHLAAEAGFRTAAIMPAITLDWPEADFMGFDTVLAAADLGYRGQPFNWVTMPDQFTLAALDRILRPGAGGQKLFAQVALVSSHAPWVPVPALVSWDEIDDGRIFDAFAGAGDPPEVVWRDNDRVRAQYRLAIDYALQTVFAYAARHAGDPPLLLVIGDHQPTGFVALDQRPDVPVHLIGPESLVARAADWGWRAGLVPDEDTPVRGMDEMRDLILQSFTTGATARPAP